MSFLGDDLGFNLFVGKAFLKNLSKDPKRAVLGVDPLSTKAWNTVLGRKDKPLVDQLGGPYGGHVVSAFGKQDGGVYKRAEEAGINTENSKKMQDFAHVIAAIYGANGIANIGGGSGQGLLGGNGQTGIKGPMSYLKGGQQNQINPMWGQQGQTIPGISGNVSTGSGIYGSGWSGVGQGQTAAQGGLMGQLGGAQGAAKLGSGLLGSMPQQQQQQQQGPKPYLYRGQIVWM